MDGGPSPSPGRTEHNQLIDQQTSANNGKERTGVAPHEDDYDDEYGEEEYDQEEDEDEDDENKKQDIVKDPSLNISKRPSK